MKRSWVCFKIHFNKINFLKKEHFAHFIEKSSSSKNKKNIVLIDDEYYLYKESWEYLNPNIHFIYFSQYDDFFESLDLRVLNLNDIDLVITDYYFDKISRGMTLFSSNYLERLKNIYGYKKTIILASNSNSKNSYEIFDRVIDKIPIKLDQLIQ